MHTKSNFGCVDVFGGSVFGDLTLNISGTTSLQPELSVLQYHSRPAEDSRGQGQARRCMGWKEKEHLIEKGCCNYA